MVDHVITSERIYKQLTEALKEYALIQIRVTYPLSEIRKKKKSVRTDALVRHRPHARTFILKRGYDLTLNTLELSPQECAEQVCELFD